MFSRNRSTQLLELPLLSRFAADFRRRTRAFAYKLPHKIHNTSPRRAITTEDSHRSREFRQNRGGIPSPIVGFQNKILHRPTAYLPFPVLHRGSIAKPLRSFPELAPPLQRRRGCQNGKLRMRPPKFSGKKRRKRLKKRNVGALPHFSCGETRKNRGLLPNKWRLSAKNPRLLSVEVGETRSRLAVRRRMCNFATT